MKKAIGIFLVLVFVPLTLLFSRILSLEAQSTPTPVLTPQAFLPVVMRNYPPSFCETPELLEPADGAQLSTLAPLFRWNTGVITDFVQFELQVSKETAFTNWDFYLVSLGQGVDEERIAYNLLPSTLYYWRGRNVCERGESMWVVRSFTTGSGGVILPAPVLVEPVNATVVSPVTFRWNEVNGAVEYRLEWGPEDGAYFAFINTTNTSKTIYLSPGKYLWRVKGRNDYAWGELSSTATFTVTQTSSVQGHYNICEGTKCVKFPPYGGD
ncbi:MAG: fibronectin type III domain-containing protein [Candidatus Hadarchaeales archaeon]